MTYILFSIIIAFVLFPIIAAKGQLSDDNESKPYTSVTKLMVIAIFISIILSVSISLNADMPTDIGFGGFTYIIGPAFFGILVLMLYLLGVKERPDWKFIFGIVCVLINLIIGFIYFLK